LQFGVGAVSRERLGRAGWPGPIARGIRGGGGRPPQTGGDEVLQVRLHRPMTASGAGTAPDTRTDRTVGIDGSLDVSSDIAQQSYCEYEQSQVQSRCAVVLPAWWGRASALRPRPSDPCDALPRLCGVAMRTRHRRRDGGEEHVSATAGVGGAVDRSARVAHSLDGQIRRMLGGLRVPRASVRARVAASANGIGEARSHCFLPQ
jgi:hypothetical protein